MIYIRNLYNNIIANRWKERYAGLPDDIKEQIDKLDDVDCQLNVIKRKRAYPNIGDIFQINPKDDIYLYGMVINNHIDNINGDDLLLVYIFKEDVNIEECISNGVKSSDLLIPPEIVGNEYWQRGYFYNVKHYENEFVCDNYGFYSIGKAKFFDEYGNDIGKEPELLGIFGVSTIIGVGTKVYQELIILGRIKL